MGARFRLRAGFNISTFSPNTQVVLRAFQHYGLILADNGADWFFGGTTNDWWGTAAGDTVVNELKTIPAAQFDAIDESSLQVAAGSYRASGSVTVMPAIVGFGGQAPGTSSGAQTVTLHNNQAVVLNVSAVAVNGANAANYVKGADGCTGIPVAANGTCTVQVSFRPGAFGGFPAALTFADNGPTTTQSASLNGTGALDNQGHLYTLDGWGGVHADGSAPNRRHGRLLAGRVGRPAPGGERQPGQ